VNPPTLKQVLPPRPSPRLRLNRNGGSFLAAPQCKSWQTQGFRFRILQDDCPQ
jgi:hypothetical protein